jgi:hypothetical protein
MSKQARMIVTVPVEPTGENLAKAQSVAEAQIPDIDFSISPVGTIATQIFCMGEELQPMQQKLPDLLSALGETFSVEVENIAARCAEHSEGS